MIQLSIHTKTMQTKITSLFIGCVACSLAWARPQGNINNFPFRPTFSDLDPYNYYTTALPYQQNVMRIWPYVMDSAVSPLYNWNWYNNAYINGINNFNNEFYNNGFYNNGFYNNGFTTISPNLSNYSRWGNNVGKK